MNTEIEEKIISELSKMDVKVLSIEEVIPAEHIFVVLCEREPEAVERYVTWETRFEGDRFLCYWGHYHTDIEVAKKEFTKRCEDNRR